MGIDVDGFNMMKHLIFGKYTCQSFNVVAVRDEVAIVQKKPQRTEKFGKPAEDFP